MIFIDNQKIYLKQILDVLTGKKLNSIHYVYDPTNSIVYIRQRGCKDMKQLALNEG